MRYGNSYDWLDEPIHVTSPEVDVQEEWERVLLDHKGQVLTTVRRPFGYQRRSAMSDG